MRHICKKLHEVSSDVEFKPSLQLLESEGFYNNSNITDGNAPSTPNQKAYAGTESAEFYLKRIFSFQFVESCPNEAWQ